MKFEEKKKILDQAIIEQWSPNRTKLDPIHRPSNTCLLQPAASPFSTKAVWAGLLPSQVSESLSPPSLPDASGFPCPFPPLAARRRNRFHPFLRVARRIEEGGQDGLRRPPAGAGEEGGGHLHGRRAWSQRSGRPAVHVLRLSVSSLPMRRPFPPL